MSWYDPQPDEEFLDRTSGYLSPRKALAPPDRHIPNKAERILLTQMMQAGGLTEEQVRAVKGNRQKLAAARKSMSQGDGANKDRLKMRRLRQEAATKLGTHINDPRVPGEALRILREDQKLSPWGRRYR